MLGERSDQRGLWGSDRLYLDHVSREPSMVCWPRCVAGCSGTPTSPSSTVHDNGRDSVPPSLLATALLLQSHDKVSDAWLGHRGWDERCSCTRRKRCCSRPGPCSRVKPW